MAQNFFKIALHIPRTQKGISGIRALVLTCLFFVGGVSSQRLGAPRRTASCGAVNRALLDKLGWAPEEALGQQIWLYTIESETIYRDVAGALVIGTPLAYLAVRQWLQNFAYHVDLGPGPFLLVAGSALAIAGLTVSYHALHAARTDPATTLRNE